MKVNLSKFLHIIEQAVPFVVGAAAPEFYPLAGAIVSGMVEAEQIVGASGPEKLAHAKNIAIAAAEGYNGARQKNIIDVPAFTKVSDVLISNVITVANTIHSLPGAILQLNPPPADSPMPSPFPVDPVPGPAAPVTDPSLANPLSLR